jgi:hypothetical protein
MVTVDPTGRSKSAVSETVSVFSAPDPGVLCRIDFTVKLGTTTFSGSAPFGTPYRAAPGLTIAADAIEPTMSPLAALISADTLTTGESCAVALFVNSNVTSHAVPDTVPPDAAVNTSCPVVCVHAPLVPNRLSVETTVKLLPGVCDPVSPVIVTVDPSGRSKSAVSETVSVLVAPDPGVVCRIDFTVKLGTTTFSGSSPVVTPYRAVPGLTIAADAIEPTLTPPSLIAADTLTAGESCAVARFVKVNVTTHSVPDTVPPDAAVNTSVPVDSVHAPLVPNRFPVEPTVKLALFAVCDSVSPVIVTLDPSGRLKSALSETVSVLVAPDPGVLCRIDFTVKLGTTTFSGSSPVVTPYSAAPGLTIAADAIEPTLTSPSSIAADTLTAGESCAVAGFVKVTVTTHSVPNTVPPDAAVNTSVPVDWSHAPLVPNRFPVEVTVKLAPAVCDPVSPVMVTVDPTGRLKSAVSETVSVLVAPDPGVLCRIDFTVKLGTTTFSGSAPVVTPYSAAPGLSIAADEIEPTLTTPS